ncbi:MAG: DUF3024 domain-containing protein [bacterium]|nr:DUF3024 domain-containing protein [bacterium]MDT8396226.1 DUF3024 domain-containing protein [bacterium]
MICLYPYSLHNRSATDSSCLNFLFEKRRPPAHIRDKLDIGYRIDGQSVEIFEIRPVWNDPSKKIEPSIAKATYVKSKNQLKVYWMRADLKWHGYQPCPEVKTLDEFLRVVDEDQYGCFWG